MLEYYEEVQVPLGQMGRKKTSRGVVALDVNGKRLEANSPVVILDGPNYVRRRLQIDRTTS